MSNNVKEMGIAVTEETTRETLIALMQETGLPEPAIKLGSISHIDFYTNFFGSWRNNELQEGEEWYNVLQELAHKDDRRKSRMQGFTFERPLIEGLAERGITSLPHLDWLTAAKTPDRLPRPFNGEYTPLPLDKLCEDYFEVMITPIDPRVREIEYLNHDMSISEKSGSDSLEQLFASIHKEVIGDSTLPFEGRPRAPFKGRPTYLKTYDMDYVDDVVRGKCGEGRESIYTIRFHIDITKLLALRDIYSDPEASQLCRVAEFGNTFMVYGGIPIFAISSFHIGRWLNEKTRFLWLQYIHYSNYFSYCAAHKQYNPTYSNIWNKS